MVWLGKTVISALLFFAWHCPGWGNGIGGWAVLFQFRFGEGGGQLCTMKSLAFIVYLFEHWRGVSQASLGTLRASRHTGILPKGKHNGWNQAAGKLDSS